MRVAIFFLIGVFIMAAGAVPAGNERPFPKIGAIRWDAWTGGTITVQVEKTLAPEKHRFRLPWFSEINDDGTVSIKGGSQEVMDREITFAADAGLDYWAFLIYPVDSPMSVSLANYLKSKKRDSISFCMILHNSLKVKEELWPAELERAIGLMSEKGYQMINDRPLVYSFIGNNFPEKRFIEFKNAAKAKGLIPYCVFMGWKPDEDYAKMKDKGFDAVSNYAKTSSSPKFKTLADSVEREYWNRAADKKVPYVPLVTTGWNKEPRKDNPVSWEKGHPYHRQTVFTAPAEPDEIAVHLERGIEFVKNHPDVCAANTLIIYSWNEHDEGGWLCPTYGKDEKPDTSRLDRIRTLLKPGEKGIKRR